MKRTTLCTALVLLVLGLGGSRVADAHCEVPCGIYADQMRFEQMLEDTATIKKAMGQINDLAGKTDGQSVNQRVRWVTTKEGHATHTMEVIAHAFRAQKQLHKTWRRLEPKVGSKKAVVAMARKLAGFVWALWRAEPELLTARN